MTVQVSTFRPPPQESTSLPCLGAGRRGKGNTDFALPTQCECGKNPWMKMTSLRAVQNVGMGGEEQKERVRIFQMVRVANCGMVGVDNYSGKMLRRQRWREGGGGHDYEKPEELVRRLVL